MSEGSTPRVKAEKLGRGTVFREVGGEIEGSGRWLLAEEPLDAEDVR